MKIAKMGGVRIRRPKCQTSICQIKWSLRMHCLIMGNMKGIVLIIRILVIVQTICAKELDHR